MLNKVNNISMHRWIIISGVIFLPILTSTPVHALSEISPRIRVEQAFVENTSGTLDETGQITKISPRISYQYSQSRLDLTLDYAYNIIINTGLEEEDREEQALNFLTQLEHIPNRWNSQIRASISQQNVADDGVIIVNDLFTSSNTRELKTFGIGTNYQGFFTQDIRYLMGVSADYADYEDQDDTQSMGLNLGMNNSRSANKFTWNTNLQSDKFEAIDADEQITSLQIGLNYRFSPKYSTYLTAEKVDTDNDNFNDTSTLVGFWWQPSRYTSFRIGVGERGDQTTYTLDSTVKQKRLNFSASYSEVVTTERSLALEQVTNPSGLVTVNQTLSINPVLVKQGTIGLGVTGRRTNLNLSYFNQVKNIDNVGTQDEKSDGLSLVATRTLSRFSTASFNISRRNVESTKDNTVDDVALSYNRQWSEQLDFSATIRNSKQTADDPANEYEQKSISFAVNAAF